MQGNKTYLIVFVVFALLTFVLPNYVLTFFPWPCAVFCTLLATGFLAAYLYSEPSIMQHLEKIDENGKKDDKYHSYVTIAAFFIFVGINGFNITRGEKNYFKSNGIEADAIVLSGEQKTSSGRRSSSKKTTLQVSYTDKSNIQHEATTEIDDDDFDKYSIGQPIKVRYLPTDFSYIMVVE
jgi:hypothetical protein